MKKKYLTLFLFLLIFGINISLLAQYVPQLVKEINPTANNDGNSNPSRFFEYNNQLYFNANDGSFTGLYKTNGTVSGTVLLKNGITQRGAFQYNDNMYLIIGKGLYRSNSTLDNVDLIKQFGDIIEESIYVWNDKIYFYACATLQPDLELWVSDGTTAGTTILKDIYPGTSQGSVYSDLYRKFVEFNDKLYFCARNGLGFEVWYTDGTAEGTQMLKDINEGNGSSINGYGNFLVLNSWLYFAADDGVHGMELWRTDGTANGTMLFSDINPGAGSAFNENSSFFQKASFGLQSKILFPANDGSHGMELWISNGTVSGTVLLNDINPGENSSILLNYSDLGNVPYGIYYLFNFYFAADNGTHGRELWKTNGTEAGTVIVKDILSGVKGSISNTSFDFEVYHNKVYFTAASTEGCYHLFRTDGTDAGTEMIAPETVIIANPDPGNLFNVGNRTLYFNARYLNIGIELHKLEIPYTISTVSDPQNAGNIIGGGPYLVGDTVDLAAVAVKGYEFVNWTNSSGTEVSDKPVYSFTMPSYDRTYTAHFKETTGIKEVNELGVCIYPNPGKENILIKGISETTQITLYQITGCKVMETILNTAGSINISNLVSGIYLGEFKNTQGKSVLKIIKQ